MHVHKRLQANFWLNYNFAGNSDIAAQAFTTSNYYANVFKHGISDGTGNLNVVIPYYWGDEYAEISDSDASSFVAAIYGTRTASYYVQIVVPIVGGVFFIISMICLVRTIRKTRSTI